MYTSLKNKYEEYWVKNEKEWHQNKIGIYHISSVGCTQEGDSHSGPCLRQTFYEYVNPIQRSISTEGNFDIGRKLHKLVQKIYKKNHPNAIIEFPLLHYFGDIRIAGSIDTVEFNEDGSITVIDFKSASDYTFPKNKFEKNSTHFNQVYLYAFWLKLLLANGINIKSVKVVYINKHNLYTSEQEEEYDMIKATELFDDFVNRCHNLNRQLKTKELPDRELMRWCKYCEYRFRCRDNVIYDDELIEHTIDEVEKAYTEETGKSPVWRGKYSKAFEKYKEGYKIKNGTN